MSIGKEVYKKYEHEARTSNKEFELFHESKELNIDCSKAIDRSMREIQSSLTEENLTATASKILNEYGQERVEWVLAATIQEPYNMKHYSPEKLLWAKGFDIPCDLSFTYTCSTQPELLNGFIDHVRGLCTKKEKSALAPNDIPNLKEGKEKFMSILSGDKSCKPFNMSL